jgi:hypothetical protein
MLSSASALQTVIDLSIRSLRTGDSMKRVKVMGAARQTPARAVSNRRVSVAGALRSLGLGIATSLVFVASAQACFTPPNGHWRGTFSGSLSGEWNAHLVFTETAEESHEGIVSGTATNSYSGEAGSLTGTFICGKSSEIIEWRPSGYLEAVNGGFIGESNTEASGTWVLTSFPWIEGEWKGAIYPEEQSEGTQPGSVEVINPPGTLASSLSVEVVSPSVLPPGVVAPVGALSFSVSGVSHGSTIDVTLLLPPGSEPTEVYKWAGSEYRLYPAEKTKIAGNKVTLELTDNEAPWDEDPELGVIGDAVVPVRAQVGPPPTLTKLSPKKGLATGGKSVKITGTNFIGVTRVKFGSTDAASFTVNSATSLTAVSPVGTNGTVDVTVWNGNGGSPLSTQDHFQFEGPAVTNLSPNHGSTAGGTTVTVAGTGFGLGSSATVFKFGKTLGTSVNCTATTNCTVVAPAAKKGKAGTVDVTATVSGKTTKKSPPADQFTYN